MKQKANTLLMLSAASIKMYFRDKTAVFFTFIFPVIFLVVFGFISTGGDLKLSLSVHNDSESEIAQQVEVAIREVPIFEISEEYATLGDSTQAIKDQKLNYALHIPENFSASNGELVAIMDEANTNFKQTFESVISEILASFNKQAIIASTGSPPLEIYSLKTESVQSEELGAINYLVPGIIAFSVMSLGVFSVSNAFVSYKSSGALRRMFVTPVGPFSFIAAQSVARLLMTIINVITMLLLALWFFDFQLLGDFITFTVVGVLGAVLFLGFGFAIAGWAKDENQAAPLSNIIFFPMMFLSGTFFPRELFPDWLSSISEYLPLSYFADAMRLVSNEGASIFQLGNELTGMVVWTAVIYFIAAKVFRYE